MFRKRNKSPEHKEFSKSVIEMFSPLLKDFGFVLESSKVKEYSSTIVFRNGQQYIKIQGSTYPTDYPYSYNVILGNGGSEKLEDFDFNSIALWRLKNKITQDFDSKEFEFPKREEINYSLKKAREDLEKYGIQFLNGNLSLFEEVLKEQNKDRRPPTTYRF